MAAYEDVVDAIASSCQRHFPSSLIASVRLSVLASASTTKPNGSLTSVLALASAPSAYARSKSGRSRSSAAPHHRSIWTGWDSTDSSNAY